MQITIIKPFDRVLSLLNDHDTKWNGYCTYLGTVMPLLLEKSFRFDNAFLQTLNQKFELSERIFLSRYSENNGRMALFVGTVSLISLQTRVKLAPEFSHTRLRKSNLKTD